MLKTLPNSNITMQLPRLQLLSTRLTIGSAVCFTEGLSTSLMVLVPQNNWYFIVGALLAFCIWLVSFRFRDTKMGADISDLCFVELLVRVAMPLLYYTNTINVDNFSVVYFWYAFAAISMIKILRVYLWEQSTTQQHGWGTFGLMTYRYAKHYAPTAPTIANKQRIILAAEILLVLIIASGCSLWIKTLEDYERVLLMWVVPFTFEFWLGPIQLRKLKGMGGMLATKDEQIADLTAKLEIAESKNQLLREMGNLPDEQCIELINAYRVLPPEKQIGLVLWAKMMVENFGPNSTKSDKH